MSTSCCMCEPMEAPQSLDERDTAKVGTRARTAHKVRSFMSVGWKLSPSTRARTRNPAKMNVRPRPLVKVNRQR